MISFKALLFAFTACATATPRPPLVFADRSPQTLARAGGALAYEDSGGTGRLIVCVPGIGDVRAQFRFLAPPLVAAGFRVVALDLRGLGDSSASFADYTPTAVGADIVALLDALEARDAVIVGSSFAAAAGIWAAAERPSRIGALVLVGPFVRDMPLNFGQRLLLALAFDGPWARSAWSSYYRSLYISRPPSDLATYTDTLVANLGESGRVHALRAMLHASKTPCEKRIGEVRAKTLVIMGAKDPDFADAQKEADSIASRLGGEVFLVSGAGHYPHVEYADAVAARVISFATETP